MTKSRNKSTSKLNISPKVGATNSSRNETMNTINENLKQQLESELYMARQQIHSL
jgi:hypothetical protein